MLLYTRLYCIVYLPIGAVQFNGTLIFSNSNDSICVDILAVEDVAIGNDLRVTLTLVSVDRAAVQLGTALLVIREDDST